MLYFVKEEYLPNAAETNRLFAFIKGFRRLGAELTVLYVNKCPYEEIYGVPVISPIGGSKNRIIHKLFSPFLLYRKLRKLSDKDTVVFYSAMLVLVVPLLLRKGIKAKLFYECTENPEVIRPNTLFYRLYRKSLFKCCKNLDGMFVISTALREYFCSKGVAEEKIHIINMTVDPSRFEGLTKQEVAHTYIAYCGTASNNKDGVDELIKAFSIVSKQYPEYRLLIIGKGLTVNDESGNRELVESLQLEEKVVFTGVVASDKMPQLLKNAVALVLDRPDNVQAKYGFPTKLGEYLLSENPVVVTSVGDIPFFLSDGDNALMAEPQNAESFSSKLIWVIEHPTEAKKIGKKGAMVALMHFNALEESRKMAQILGVL